MKRIIISIVLIALTINIKSQEVKYMPWLKQINAKAIHEEGLSGKGVKIGIIDAGFNRADTAIYTKYLFKRGQIKFVKNYVDDTCTNIFNALTDHGFMSLAQVAGIVGDSLYYGLAQDAEFYLARTEYGPKDHREEEKNFEKAVEELYELGVRLINVSLSYTDNFEKEIEAYKPEDINGKTAYITKVCESWAAKGVIFVVGSGNKGLNKWKVLGAPADAQNVITVGATGPALSKISELNEKTSFKAGFSSIGSEKLGYIKPELALYSAWGTSFTAPVVTGVIACMLQKNPDLNIDQIKEILISSANLNQVPNNYIGYGVPDCKKIMANLNKRDFIPISTKFIEGNKKCIIKTQADDIVAFHKKNEINVVKQKRLSAKNGEVLIKQIKDSKYTTVVMDKDKVYEIKWQ